MSHIDPAIVARYMASTLLSVASFEDGVFAYLKQHLLLFQLIGGFVSILLFAGVVFLVKKTLDTIRERYER